MNNEIVQGLWIGGELSPLEVLSIKSFIDHGHDYHLYVYGEVKNIPTGTIIKDGREILPEEEIFTYQSGFGKGSYSAFSNYFRYMMLVMNGGWYVDTDMICIKPWDFEEDYVFISEEEHGTGDSVVNSGAIKVPEASEIMKGCWNFCCDQDKKTLQWGTVGPKLLGDQVKKHKLESYVKDRGVFCVIAPFMSQIFVTPMSDPTPFPDDVYGLHMFNEAMKHFGIDKREKFDESCIYEKLKKLHNVV